MKPIQLTIGSMICFALLCSACEMDSLQNQSFDAWCGDNLCLWETNEGAIEKVSTWHEEDYGASFLEDPSVISQQVLNGSTKCFLFTVMADVADDAALYLEIDYLDDDLSNPEFSQRIEAPDWNKVKVDAVVPSWCDEFRIILRKTGSGKAVVASIYDERYDSCPMEVPEDERPTGFVCADDDECKDAMCDPFVAMDDNAGFYSCGTCSTASDCETGEACGLESSRDREVMYRACGEPARHTLGERCLFDDECKSDICCGGQCSQCCNDDDCDEALSCIEAAPLEPHRCAPEAGAQPEEAPCLKDEDCESGVCEASVDRSYLSICTSDGRLCTSNDDCPGYLSNDAIWQVVTDYTGTGDRCEILGAFDGVCR